MPYGDGLISIHRTMGKRAQVVHHYFGGAVQQQEVAIDGGRLDLNAKLMSPANKPLEWMEVHIS